MAFSLKVEGMEELYQEMEKLPKKAAKIAAEALYEGAGVAADAVSKSVHGINTQTFRYAAGGEKRLPSPEEKAIIEQARRGVSKFRKTGNEIQTSVGFSQSGYGAITWNHAKTNASRTKYKKGERGWMVHASVGSGKSMKPVPLIANAIEHGTSFMNKQPFFRKANSQSNGAAMAAIENGIKNRLDELEIN